MTEHKDIYTQLTALFNREWGTHISLKEWNKNSFLPRVDLNEQTLLFSDRLETLILLFNFFMADKRAGSDAIHHFLLYHLAIRKNMYGKAEELLGLLDKDVEKLSRSIPEDQVSFYHFLAEYQTCFILAHEFSHIHYYIDKQGLEQNLPSMKESLIWLRNQLNTGKPLLARLIHFLVPRMRRLQEHSFDEAIEKPELQEELLCDDAAWRITNYLIKTNIPDAEVRAVLSAFVVFTTYYIETQRTLENIYMTADNNLRQRHLMFDTTRSTVLVHTAWDDVEPAAIRHYKSLVNNLCRAGRVWLMLSLRSNVEHIAYLRLMPKEKYSLQEVKRLDTMFGEVDAKVRRRERQSE